MTSSAADRFQGGGGGGEEQLLLLLLRQPQMCYHVAQHSRREKLRFPPEEANSFLLLHDPNAAPQLSAADSLTAAFVASSSSASTSTYYPHNHDLNYGVLPIPAQQPYHQISNQGFSLSLSSSSSSSLRLPTSRHHIASRPAHMGPFTGYAAVLDRSRFLGPARKLLEEACHVGQQAAGGGSSGSGGGGQELLPGADPPGESLVDHGLADHGMDDDRPIFGMDQQWKKTRLVSMLDEVFRRYKQYYHQVQAVITSFESVAGLSAAAPFASMALKAMSKHFRCLKNMISDQLRRSNNGVGDEGIGREDDSSFGLLNSNGCLGRTINSDGTIAQPHVWRPQRGLPERAVSVLRTWLFKHFLHPYPTDMDKQNLAKQTGLTRNQVSNWFINARVRLWKPMVEEVHSLEMQQKHQPSSAGREQPRPPSSSQVNPFGSELFSGASNHEHVSLTLGLDECGDAFFGKDGGSRLLQDFVG